MIINVTDGKTPYIGDNGTWWIGGTDTGVIAAGTDGIDGTTPHIGDNGNWFIGTTDTGVRANGQSNTEIIPVSIAASDWNAETKEVTIDCIGVSANEAEQIITLIPSTESKEICNKAGIDCSGFNTNTITLKATTIPTEDINIYVAIEATGGAKDKDVYSTEEQVVGTWINGKPVYRKTAVIGGAGNIDIVGDIDELVSSTGYSVVSNIQVSCPYCAGNNFSYIEVSPANVLQLIRGGTYKSSFTTFTVEYTKTTDTATVAIPSATALTEAYEEGVNEA